MQAIIRFLTDSDFFNIYKPAGIEQLGGGQSYIDFPVNSVSINNWISFFQDVNGVKYNTKPLSNFNQYNWEVPILSDGEKEHHKQMVKIYRRRKDSISIASQKITSSQQNRIRAWLPKNGFPEPLDPTQRHERPESLCIILYKINNEIHAGWRMPASDTGSSLSNLKALQTFIDDKYDELKISNTTNSGYAAFFQADIETNYRIIDDTKQTEANLLEDLEQDLLNLETNSIEKEDTKTQRMVNLAKRNQTIVTKLKQLYNGECQVTGTQHTFKLSNGQYYSEAHHLIPLGKGGSDSPSNIIIICPTLHRMLHTLKPVSFDFKNMKDNILPITIGTHQLFIKYNPSHTKIIEEALKTKE